jgi:hypothetical protein
MAALRYPTRAILGHFLASGWIWKFDSRFAMASMLASGMGAPPKPPMRQAERLTEKGRRAVE